MGLYFSASEQGFYDSDIHGEVPVGAVAITEAEHQSLLSAQAQGKVIVPGEDGRPVAVDPAPPPLADLQARAIDQIDVEAGNARAAWVSKGAYLDAEYERAVEQAVAYQADPNGDYPALQADLDAGTQDPRLGRAVQTLAEAADLILYTRGVWMAALDQIRATRLCAKAAVRQATSADEIQTILDGLTWPVPHV